MIGQDHIRLPANTIRFEEQRRPGRTERVDLYLTWPEMNGYSNDERIRFNDATRPESLIFLNLSQSTMSRDMSGRLAPFMPDPLQRVDFLRIVHQEALRARLEPELVLAVIQIESRFDRFALSSAGAQGYMQIMPFWLREIGDPQGNLFDPRTNLRMGCTILRYYLDRTHDDWVSALARYNGSSGRADYPYRVLRALNGRWAPG